MPDQEHDGPEGSDVLVPPDPNADVRIEQHHGGVLGAYRARRRAKKAARSKFRRRATRLGMALALLVVVVVGGSGVYLEVTLHKIHHLVVPNVKPVPKSGADDILLVGSTSRCAVEPAQNFQNFVKQCDSGVNGVNSDVIMILRLVPGRVPTLLSLPRDTFVPDARAGGLANKIDAALADGPDQLIQAIEEDFGIPINHYVVLNFESFADIVHALGGITMYFPTSLQDQQSGLDISHSGCLHISGLEALALVRARHLQYDYDKKTKTWLGYDGSGDIGRIERVHIFLKVLAQQVAAKGVANPIVDNSLLSSIAPFLTVDSTLSTSTMLQLILDDHSKAASAPELTLPVIEDTNLFYEYKGYNYGAVVFPSEPQDQQAIDEFMGGKPVGASLNPSTISVSIEDGSGSPSAATTTAAELRALGYQVSDASAVSAVGPISETTVFYAGPSHLAQAERVLRSLSGAVVLAKGPTVGGADVTVLTGSDLAVGEPTATAVASYSNPVVPAGVATFATLLGAVLSSATNSVAAANSVLAPPTPSITSIPSYDPRACPKK